MKLKVLSTYQGSYVQKKGGFEEDMKHRVKSFLITWWEFQWDLNVMERSIERWAEK